MRKPDFFVIGAMKSGTTSLHYYLKQHPRIFLPAEKEVPFLANDELYARGLDWCLQEFFRGARPGQLIGTVSPQYMTDSRVPGRMHEAFPQARLVAILRDPMSRAVSHYKMMVRAFNERRPFAEAMQGHYVEAGEYGRILGEFAQFYPRERLRVLFLRDLEIDPGSVLAQVYGFLGLEMPDSFVPVGKRNSGDGSGLRPVARFAANTIHSRLRPLRPLIKKLLPERYTRRVGMWTIMYRSKIRDPAGIDVSLPPQRGRELARHYLEDLAALEDLLGRPAPWRDKLERLADETRA